jgi:hypothetical protein
MHLGTYVLSAARRRVSDAARTDYRRSAIEPELELEAAVEQRLVATQEGEARSLFETEMRFL